MDVLQQSIFGQKYIFYTHYKWVALPPSSGWNTCTAHHVLMSNILDFLGWGEFKPLKHSFSFISFWHINHHTKDHLHWNALFKTKHFYKLFPQKACVMQYWSMWCICKSFQPKVGFIIKTGQIHVYCRLNPGWTLLWVYRLLI